MAAKGAGDIKGVSLGAAPVGNGNIGFAGEDQIMVGGWQDGTLARDRVRNIAAAGAILVSLAATIPPVPPASAAAGVEFRVNTYTAGNQDAPSVGALSGGGFVVTWVSFRQDGDWHGVYGQRYDSAGKRVGSEFRVNADTVGHQFEPSVAGLSDGGFVVAWVNQRSDLGRTIKARRYDSAGRRVGGEFFVTPYMNMCCGQDQPSVAGLSTGGFVVTWTVWPNGEGGDVYGQRYDNAGNPVGGRFLVNTYRPNNQIHPSVAGLSDGSFVVTWESIVQDGSRYGVYGQRYDSAGNPAGGEFRANTYTTLDQRFSSVGALTNGGFVVTWSSLAQDGSGYYGVYGQIFDNVGNRIGGNFRVNTYTRRTQWQPSVGALSGGGFVVIWTSDLQDGDSWGVYGQRYDSAGRRIGGEFRINVHAARSQSQAVAVGLSGGGFVAIWTWWADVYGRLFAH